MELFVTPYRICTGIFIKVYCGQKNNLAPRENGKICLFILDLTRQSEYPFRQLIEMIESKCDSIITAQFRKSIDETVSDINNLFELVKHLIENPSIETNSVSGLFLRKLKVYFDRLTHQASSRLYDDLVTYVSNPNSVQKRRIPSVAWQTPRTTRSSGVFSDTGSKNIRPIYQINHEIARLQANEQKALNPKDLYESLRRPNNSCKGDATFLRYLNLLRVNECVGSKHLLMAYFDMVSDSVSRSYSALNYAIWYLHHGDYKRAIECLQECYCCAQAADDDKCLLTALMWLARIVIQAKQKKSTKYNVGALLELVRKRSHNAGLAYVQAMTSMTLDQLTGPVDDSETLKKSSETIKQVAMSSRQHSHLMANSNQPNPLDKDDTLPSAEVLAVRNSMNDVLAMYYALLSAHLSLMDANQSSALASQTLLHFDLIEKCGNEDVYVTNENTFIALRNLAFHVWNSTRDIHLVREILVDLCSSKIANHRSDNHSIWRQALSEISFEYYVEQENWTEAMKMIWVIRETDQDGAQLREAELLKLMGINDESLHHLDELISRIDMEENNSTDPVNISSSPGQSPDASSPSNCPTHPSASIEHKAFIKAKALLLRATLIDDETKILESLQYASENRFQHVKTACLMQLARRSSQKSEKVIDSIVIEVFANGTRSEKRELRQLLASYQTV